MPDYSELYKEIFQAVTKAVDILQEAQIRTEEIYISSEPTAITVLHGNNSQYEKKSGESGQTEIFDKETLRKIIGENIQALRLKHSMSIDELSEKLGITSGYLGLLERGRRGVTTHNLSCLSHIFSISIDDFFKPLNIESKEIKEIKEISAT